MPVVPATQAAEAGESLEPGRVRLQGAKIITSLHNSVNIPKLNCILKEGKFYSI